MVIVAAGGVLQHIVDERAALLEKQLAEAILF